MRRRVNPDIFWTKVRRSDDGCWMWTGRKTKGYGHYGSTTAHRISYQLSVGPIPDGLELDHLCGMPLCVNPDHLEPVTRDENMRRRYADYTHCANGHEFSAVNTYIRPNGRRDCRTCIRLRVRAYQLRRSAA